MRRGFWFVAGAGAGVYVVVKARRAAEAFTPDGLRDRLEGLQVGAQLFAEEVRAGMSEREAELRERFALLDPHRALDGPLALDSTTEADDPERLIDPFPAPPALEGTH
ncbi:MAG: DUF6167 family protein [Propionibacteriales bacterium]|nr:DUF6167 family protein [Propionibacteriales bacterium]